MQHRTTTGRRKVFNGKEPIAGPQEIEPLGPGYGYRVRVFREGMVIELGVEETFEGALEKLNKVKEAMG